LELADIEWSLIAQDSVRHDPLDSNYNDMGGYNFSFREAVTSARILLQSPLHRLAPRRRLRNRVVRFASKLCAGDGRYLRTGMPVALVCRQAPALSYSMSWTQ
jgi:hypothetical protein